MFCDNRLYISTAMFRTLHVHDHKADCPENSLIELILALFKSVIMLNIYEYVNIIL